MSWRAAGAEIPAALLFPLPIAPTHVKPVSLPYARVTWRDGVPFNLDFDDIYFSRVGGLDEVHQVYLGGNGLPERWHGQTQFTIAETGFGTGLNFLATAAQWRDTAAASARLHYVSCEAFPLAPTDLAQAAALWPELSDVAAELLAVYPPPVPGFHRRSLLDGRIRLTLLFGDAVEMLREFHGSVDAWYLDGFAPRKNEAMWSTKLWPLLARCSAPGATLATFTVAGDVRRGAQSAGFRIEKRPGFGGKREMLTATLQQPAPAVSPAPWFVFPPPQTERDAVVIGAGIAGITVSHALAARGWRVRLVEGAQQVANGASGNAAGILMPRLAADMAADAQFSLAAFLYTTHWLGQLASAGHTRAWHPSGILHLLDDDAAAALTRLHFPAAVVERVDQARASAVAGLSVARGALHFPGAGWLEPVRLCRDLLALHNNVEVLAGRTVTDLHKCADQWVLWADGGELLRAPVVIVAMAAGVRRFEPLRDLPVLVSRGQLTQLRSAASLTGLRMPLCGTGYVIPTSENEVWVGASYGHEAQADVLNPEDQAFNLQNLARLLPDSAVADAPLAGRAALRATVLDHLPIVGPVVDRDAFSSVFGDLHHGRSASRYPAAPYISGLYVNTGHGSRGLATCPLAAELLADMLDGVPLPLPQSLIHLLHPARFLVRQLRRTPPATRGS